MAAKAAAYEQAVAAQAAAKAAAVAQAVAATQAAAAVQASVDNKVASRLKAFRKRSIEGKFVHFNLISLS